MAITAVIKVLSIRVFGFGDSPDGGMCLARALGLSLLLIASFILSISRPSWAQTSLIGTGANNDEMAGYAISQNGSSIVIESVGQIVPTGKVGHLLGRFIGGQERELIKVRKIRRDTLLFEATGKNGERLIRRVRLSNEVGQVYYLLTGFNISGDDSDDVAIIDVTGTFYRWSIIQDPMKASAREIKSFRFGLSGDRVEWHLSPNREIVFSSVRQTINSGKVRALLRNSATREINVLRSRWKRPIGLLIPLRLRDSFNHDPGIALYSPAKKTVLRFDGQGGICKLRDS